MPQQYKRQNDGIRLDIQGGMNTVLSPDLLRPGQYAYLQNVRRYLQGRTVARAPLGANVLSGVLGHAPASILRLNDTTPAGPGSGYALIIGGGGSLYVNTTEVKTGLSGKPLSFMTFRPNASPQPWAYVGDETGMWKVRSDGTIWKAGIAEPQVAPGANFIGGGSGTNPIVYRYVYRSSVTGALSNPSPESIAGTNAQSSPSATVNASDYATKITYNATQYEYVAPQLRTKGGVNPGTVTDWVYAHNFGFAIPSGVNIDGVQIDLNWVGQNAGTGVLSGVRLYYQGAQIGTTKFPGIQNQSYPTDVLQGGNSDTWGATLSPTIVNDNSFGFGVQITTQNVGGTDRSFLDSFTVTVYYSTQNAQLTPVASSDPQVDKIDYYRMGGALPSFTYVGTSSNTSSPYTDTLSDLAAVNNPLLEFDNYEPFPGIDMPRKGVVNVAAGSVAGTMAVTWVSGDAFNVAWLPGTIMVIGGVAYTLYNRPTSTSALTVVLPDTLPGTTTNLTYEIAEPILAAQPSPVIWGPTPDNAGAFYFGLDQLNTGDLLWSKGNNFDSAPDTNRLTVTSPAEPLMNGTITSELSTVFSTERFWLIYPNFADALATVTGTEGQQWTIVQSAATRGLYMRYAIAAQGAMIAWRAKDCICVSMGGGKEESITDAIYNLFPHEGQVPQPVTIGGQTVHPPDDTKPNAQTIAIAVGYIYYDYQDTTGTPRTLVYDMEGKGWSVDAYSPAVNCHSWEIGPGVNNVLCGCTDGTVRAMTSGGTETGTAVLMTRSEDGGDARAFKRIGDVFLKALVTASNPVTVGLLKSRGTVNLTGFAPASLTGAGTLQPYVVDFTAGYGSDVDDIAALLSWPLGSGNVLDLWQPDWTSLPETIQDRPTDWDDAGSPGNKFVQGALVELDTFNAAKSLKVERSDDGTLYIPNESPLTVNGQTVVPITFTPPFQAHMLRIVSTDGVPWRLWGVQWVTKPFPESVMEWQTEMLALGLKGWMHIPWMNLAYQAAAPVTVTLRFDRGGTVTLTFPAASAQAKQFMTLPANKFKMVSFQVTSTAPFNIFEPDCEVAVRAWGDEGGYSILRPFGGPDAPGAEV